MSTRLLYESDPYLTRFDATVLRVEGDWIVLDRTAFFPGGGGQDTDRGWIEDLDVEEVKGGEEVRHKVPDHAFTIGQRVECEIDWERRHDLMRGHTGEHLLFSALSKINPEIELVKIAITPKKKCFVVNGDVNWSLLSRVQEEANAAIAAQLPVTETCVAKDSEVLREIRIKVDRIHGEKVRIVSIGEIDKAACAGVHIQNTRELRMLLVTRLTSAKPSGDVEIEFETGKQAMESALRLSTLALQGADILGAVPEDLIHALDNLGTEAEKMRIALKGYTKQVLAELKPEIHGQVRILHGAFQDIDKRTLMDAANEHAKQPLTAVVLASMDERVLLVVAASPDLQVDCREVLHAALRSVGGKGGGSTSFASGGGAPPEKGEEAVAKALEALKARLPLT